MSDGNVIARNVSMYQEQWEIIEKVARRKDYLFEGNVSRALRFIVEDWARTRREKPDVRLDQEELEPPYTILT